MRDRLLEMSAGEFVKAPGINALVVLRERAEMARALGYVIASRSRQEMASAGERILNPLDRDV
jgi:hypothetical protein